MVTQLAILSKLVVLKTVSVVWHTTTVVVPTTCCCMPTGCTDSATFILQLFTRPTPVSCSRIFRSTLCSGCWGILTAKTVKRCSGSLYDCDYWLFRKQWLIAKIIYL